MLTRAAKSKERKKERKKKISAPTITVVAFGDGCGGGRSCRPAAAARRGKLTGAGKGDEK